MTEKISNLNHTAVKWLAGKIVFDIMFLTLLYLPSWRRLLFHCCVVAADWCSLLCVRRARHLATNPDHRQQLCRVLPRSTTTGQGRQATWSSGPSASQRQHCQPGRQVPVTTSVAPTTARNLAHLPAGGWRSWRNRNRKRFWQEGGNSWYWQNELFDRRVSVPASLVSRNLC